MNLTIHTVAAHKDEPPTPEELKVVGEMLEEGFIAGVDNPHGLEWEIKQDKDS